MASQRILFTVVPRGMSVDAERLPVSVYVSPRLTADPDSPRLEAFPDWLIWTRRLKEDGLSLTFRCAGADFTAAVPTEILQPQLWEALFKPTTLVRSHQLDDYSDHQVISSSTRAALSLLKGIYQKAGVELALPESLERLQQQEANHYETLQNLVEGLEVNWNEERSYPQRYELQSSAEGSVRSLKRQAADRLDRDGLIPVTSLLEGRKSERDKQIFADVAKGFIASQKIPQGTPLNDNPPDFENLLDFHQALSSLNSYPELLRALGLVMDIELPRDFVAIATPGTLSVVGATPNWEWAIAPASTPLLETAYLHFAAESGSRIFFTAPEAFKPIDPNQPGGGQQAELEAFGLLYLNPQKFGLAQVDVDGAMHKMIMLAETVQRDREDRPGPADSPYPTVFDPRVTLPAMRSGGFSLYVDERGKKLLSKLKQAKAVNTQFDQQQAQAFYAENLVHGYRIDIWDNHTQQWHSLHRRNATYTLEGEPFNTSDEEGFTQLAAAQPAPDKSKEQPKDIYLQEAIARWAGWSLSVPFPDKALSSDPNPENALLQAKTDQNIPATPFKMTTEFKIVGSSLPSLRFGRRYRLRARVVDLCGNCIGLTHPLVDQLSRLFALPSDPNGVAYLRFEPVISPQVVLRDPKGVTEPGSQLDRLVIRTYNSAPAKDGDPADLTASDRHILPPRTSVEIAEKLGMLDDATGKISRSTAMYDLLVAKDGAELNFVEVEVAGQESQRFPLEAGDRIDTLPYIPDVLARGAALRDLPGTPAYSLGTVQPGIEPEASVPYDPLNDPNPRSGSATLISFGDSADWQTLQPFRLALAEGNAAPRWDAQNRVLTVSLPKGTTAVIPLSSYLHPDDLKLMGVWQWLREYIDQKTATTPDQNVIAPGKDIDKIAHILQRAVEGGHWMLTPPQLLKLVHAVQQPIGNPKFTVISVQHAPYQAPYSESNPDPNFLQTMPESTPTAATELSPITSWRLLDSTDAYLLGGLQVHGAGTARVDILAEWDDPVDDLTIEHLTIERIEDLNRHYTAPVDEIPIHQLNDHSITVTPDGRYIGYYDADHDLLCFGRSGDILGNLQSGTFPLQGQFIRSIFEGNTFKYAVFSDVAPRHQINDTKHHRVRYTAVATSRYREYFPQEQDDPLNPGEKIAVDFTRKSQPITVEVPASARPVSPQIAYVIPTFGWQRQTQTNLKRSVRFGGGLRVYLERPWFSSGEGELLGMTLFQYGSGVDIEDSRERDRWKSLITQWGNDPIWQTPGLSQVPQFNDFPDAIAQEQSLKLEEDPSKRVGVVGYPVAFDAQQQKWYCDLTIDAGTTYSPFVRLALVRYQPYALVDAKLSRVVLADFVQLTPERSVMLTADPYQPGQLRIAISGITPTQPTRSNTILIKLQERDDTLQGDLAWRDAAPELAEFSPTPNDPTITLPASVLYVGTIKLNGSVQADRYRLVISEYESFPADGVAILVPRGSRLIYCETILLDEVLLATPAITPNRTRI
ncbi:hypothetical protein GS597_15710 [Synechococcales cyanobacterium C]|uniref:Uncharacterized protein n=1 Tax=Petrachloros mirabilis ULC683 TaxID=2781853 RepID=A0A8K2A1U4_9CYAN|nr:hypothetical protein [Petrachloros mirabilis]NCJ07927.1 hypothetical protein [Petrachloros mirabilis ULC683]